MIRKGTIIAVYSLGCGRCNKDLEYEPFKHSGDKTYLARLGWAKRTPYGYVCKSCISELNKMSRRDRIKDEEAWTNQT